MELKRKLGSASILVEGLLIVPYGIETAEIDIITVCPHSLLIVPYGIET